jgi:hypothetical protein
MITQDELKSVLNYDLNTGLFVWVKPTGDRVKSGQIAGSLRPDGYVFTQINKRRFMNHRLAWLYVNGVWPSDEIDHIDGDRSNNRISNLRPATSKQNKENTSIRSTNTSGHKGVHWDKSRQKWMAFVVHNRKFHNVGRFENVNDAITATKQARDALFTHHNTSYSS